MNYPLKTIIRLAVISYAILFLASCNQVGDYKPYDNAMKLKTSIEVECESLHREALYMSDYIDALETAIKQQNKIDSIQAVVNSYYQ